MFLLIPVFFLIVAIEWMISYKMADQKYTLKNTAMNVTIGAIDRLGSLFTMAFLYIALDFVYRHFAPFQLNSVWYQWVVGYIAVDFVSYWFHRYSHEINILWAGHVTHHSSTKFNLSNGFRTSVFQGLNRIPFWCVLPLFGFSPIVLIIIFNISGLYDFFMHTPYFPSNKYLEKILITPSLHKVHHGKNDIYMDKNYGSTFSIWDRLFGTFQSETEEVEFGITGDYKDSKPIYAITYYYSLLFSAIKKSRVNPFNILFDSPANSTHISSGFSTAVNERTNVPGYLVTFALYTFISGLVIDFWALVLWNKIRIWEFLFLYGFGLMVIINAARILNASFDNGFVYRQLKVNALALFIVSVVYVFTQSTIMMNILFYCVSLVALTLYIINHTKTRSSKVKQVQVEPRV